MKRYLFNKAIRVLLFTDSLILFSGAMLGPIYALFVEEIGGDLLDASLAGAAFALAAGITTFITGKFADKIKESELIIVFGYSFMALGFLSYTMVNSIWSLLFVQMVIGFAEAIYCPAFDALYSKHLNGNRAGSWWGAYESMKYFGTACGAIIGGFIVTNFNFNTLFIVMAVLCFTSAIYIYLLPRKVL